MSEKIYALLLRLHSSHFREAYGAEAMQLFRDRARDEKGFFSKLRLWLDLLGDLVISVPRGYAHVQPDLVGASARQSWDGIPSFHVLGSESPRQGALFLGGLLSVVSLAAVPLSIGHFGSYRPPRARVLERLRTAYVPSTAVERSADLATPLRSRDAKPNAFQPKAILAQAAAGPPQPVDPQRQSPEAPRVMAQVVVESAKLKAADRQRVVRVAIANLKEHYIDPPVAQKMADALAAHENAGDYDTVTDGGAFAALLTKQLRDVSNDRRLDVIFSQAPLRPPGPSPERAARYKAAMQQQNCTFEKVEILPHNIGYLKLNSFPDPSVCQPTATAAMASLNRADAVIFDLRDNTGGYPEMVMLIAAYLFDHPEYMYNPRENTTARSWTQSPVPGSRLSDKPVYVLTSARTFSGAEHFSYDLKMLKRATIVGETTGGAAHSAVFHLIDEHFGMGITETKPINPFSTKDWEGTGVQPDIKVKATDALEKAKELAESKSPQ